MAVLELLHGDCRAVMAGLPAASVYAVVCDPPYGLSFMGKDWDHGVPGVAFWSAALRVAKPGAHLLAFGGTRTFHRLAVAIEDAGWEIRDTVMWVYGSGFPKSHDVGKGIDKRGGATAGFAQFRDDVRAAMKAANVTRGELQAALGNHMCSHYLTNASQPAIPNWRDYQVIRDTVQLGDKWDALFMPEAERAAVTTRKAADLFDAEREVANKHITDMGGLGGERLGLKGGNITAPATDAARQWDGWGTALKPAWEPIIVARKPLEGTVAANVLAHGTGAMNIDGCRVGTSESLNGGAYAFAGTERDDGWGMQRGGAGEYQQPTGRWPANLIHDGSDEVVALFPETGKSTGGRIGKKSMGNVTNVPAGQYEKGDPGYGDSGSAARFFYCAKANKDDRNEGLEEFEDRKKVFNGKTALPSPSNDVEGSVNEKFSTHPQKNHHPTVKPTALMRYLCKLVTRAGGTVLDPFCGSGSTGKAAILEGFKFIGIEKDPEYHKIAEARINLQSIVQASLPDTSHNELEVGVNTQSDMFK